MAVTVALVAPASAVAATWSPVTGETSIIQQVGKVRAPDGTLHVVWARSTPGATTQDVVHVPISASGVVGSPVVIAPSYSTVSNPAIVNSAGGGLQVFFGGIQCITAGCATGLFTAGSRDGGSTWTAPVSLFDREQVYASDVAAATLSDGTPFETWSHTTGTTVHRGVDPATPDFDFQGAMGAGCCGYHSALAADAAGRLQLAWDSNATGFEGVWSQTVDPATGAPSGAPLLMPGSVTDGSHAQMGSHTPIVALGGAFFVAYPGGYPTTTKVLLWQVGAPTAATIVDEPGNHGSVALAADATGLWVFWTGDVSGTDHVFTRRVSAAGMEPVIDLGVPPGAQQIFALDGDVGPGGEPEALALAGLADGAGTFHLRGPRFAPPVLGKAVNVAPVSGKVFVKPPKGARALTKGKGFVPLSEARQLPVGSQVDARRGTLQLTTATAKLGKTQKVTLSKGLFSLAQSPKESKKGLTTFSLLEGAFPGAPTYRSCRAGAARAHAAKKNKKVLNLLKAKGKGKFRTRGRYSAATVRGTTWNMVDRCDGTLTVVKRGSVSVQDFGRRKTVRIKAGQQYLAKAR